MRIGWIIGLVLLAVASSSPERPIAVLAVPTLSQLDALLMIVARDNKSGDESRIVLRPGNRWEVVGNLDLLRKHGSLVMRCYADELSRGVPQSTDESERVILACLPFVEIKESDGRDI